jgi:tRNA (mo5U34)-methyltransferase
MVSAAEAAAFIDDSRFLWHQRFQLVPGVYTPGVSDVEDLLQRADLPMDLSGRTVLDVGTSNAGAAFECERRGADRVVAVDLVDPSMFGIADLTTLLGSNVEFIQANAYELPAILDERFDLVLFWGVLYHLRHPLLALDSIRELCAGAVSIETAIADDELGDLRNQPLVRFYRLAELADDSSNWFAPSVAALVDWVTSSGFEAQRVMSWPNEHPTRAMVNAVLAPDPPEYRRVSYETPLQVRTAVPRGGGAEATSFSHELPPK